MSKSTLLFVLFALLLCALAFGMFLVTAAITGIEVYSGTR